MPVGLTAKQKSFLYRFLKSRNIEEAAAMCGIPPDSAYEEGMKILSHPQAAEFAASTAVIMKKFGADTGSFVEDALVRLINGRANDAVILAKADPEELSEEDVRRLDLYGVSELKFGKGVCEIKFADRLKAIEKLNEIRNTRSVDDAAQSFFDAIDSAAEKTAEEQQEAE